MLTLTQGTYILQYVSRLTFDVLIGSEYMKSMHRKIIEIE